MDSMEIEPDMPFMPVGELTSRGCARRHQINARSSLTSRSTALLTLGEIHEWSCRIVHRLEDLEIRPWRPGPRCWPTSASRKLLMGLGLMRLGAVVCPVRCRHERRDPRRDARGSGASPAAVERRRDTGRIARHARLRRAACCARWPAGEFFGPLDEVAAMDRPRRETAAADLAAIFCTSGTYG